MSFGAIVPLCYRRRKHRENHGAIAILIAIALATAGAQVGAAEAETPSAALTFCVGTTASGSGVDLGEVVLALRARLRDIGARVEACTSETALSAAFRVTISRPAAAHIELVIHGRDLEARRSLTVGRASDDELARLIALSAAEATRPMLRTQQQDEALPCWANDDAPELPVDLPMPEPAETTRQEQQDARFALGLALGPRLGIAPSSLGGFVMLEPALATGSLVFVVGVGAGSLPGTSSSTLTLRQWDLVARAQAGLRWRRLVLTAGVQSRASFASLRLAGRSTSHAGRTYWNAGASVRTGLLVLALTPVEVWLSAEAWWWPRPDRFLHEGVGVLTQSQVEVLAGPTLAFRFGSSSF